MIRSIRDYVTLVAMTNSRIEHVRDMAREVVRRAGWTARPCAGKTWRQSFTISVSWLTAGEIRLWFNDRSGSTHIVRWCDAIGIIAPDQAEGLRAMMGETK